MSLAKAISTISNETSIDSVSLSPSATQYNDSLPVWSADETKIFFISNRHTGDGKPGPAAIWVLPLKVGGEAYAISSAESKSAIDWYSLSPDERHIAYMAGREATDEEKKRDEEKDDAIVPGDTRHNNQLWLLSISTRQARRLTLAVKDNWHVITAAWSPDSKDIMVLVKADSSVESDETPIAMLRVSTLLADSKVEEVCTLPRLRVPTVLWPSMDEVALFQGYIPEIYTSSLTVYFRSSRPDPSKATKQDIWKKRFYGDVEDVIRILDVGNGGTIAPAVMVGVNTRIDVIDSSGAKKVLWKPNNDAPSGEYDVKVNKNGNFVLAMVVSSGVRFEPPELWTGSVSASKLNGGATLKLTEKLTDHHNWMTDVPTLVTEVIEYTAQDGTVLEGVLAWPKDKERKAMPTILFPHGGPYWRDPPSLELTVYGREIFAFAGYLVLCPPYRGGAGRGHAFAHAIGGNLGTIDWTDCWDLLQYAIQQGWADKDRCGLAGWSMGGYLSAWGVTQTKDFFKAAMVASGITDWGSIVGASDASDQLIAFVGSAPWSDHRKDLECSPSMHVKGVKTPVLIMHGQEDNRVPTSQGVELYRGLRRMSGYPKNHQLVLYPREGHGLSEHKHVEDALRRLIEHMDAYLK
ncbi:alpha/beta-hydrolase [Calocera cornea HHB12733]|uniref:Dipeptidyl-peptidase V n=1 Tax=Calocera cornea HHB12733 TaxID=1353952 RepID=A0A165GC37_9BASI|nr:alpha/beta-hydrolase [Calocera cornea HHB12733]